MRAIAAASDEIGPISRPGDRQAPCQRKGRASPVFRSLALPLVFALVAVPSLPALCDGGCLGSAPVARTRACHDVHGPFVTAASDGSCPRAWLTATLTPSSTDEGMGSPRELRAVVGSPAPLVFAQPAYAGARAPDRIRPPDRHPLETALRI
jgi:hypothetical protein